MGGQAVADLRGKPQMDPLPTASQSGPDLRFWKLGQTLRKDAGSRDAVRTIASPAGEPAKPWWQRAAEAATAWWNRARAAMRAGVRRLWRSRAFRWVVIPAAAVPALAGATFLYYIYFDHSDLPDLKPFLEFRPPTI